jgi:hypothetical protein
VQPGPRPLPDGLPLILREASEHLEDEPAAGVGGVYGLGGALQGHATVLQPVVGVDNDQEGPAEPIQPADEERGELVLLGILEEPPTFWSLVQRDGARYAVIGVDLSRFQAVEAAVFLKELALYLDGFAVALLLGGNAQVQGDAL